MKTRILPLFFFVLVTNLAISQPKQKVTLAFIGNFTGNVSSNGLGGRNAFIMAVKEANESKENSYHYEALILDDHCDPVLGVNSAAQASINSDVIAGVTHYCSSVAIKSIDIYHKYGLPVIIWGAVLKDITHDNHYDEIFRICGYQNEQNRVAAEFMINTQKFKNWIIIYEDSPYGASHHEYFSYYLKENGGKIVRTYIVPPKAEEFSDILEEIKNLNENYQVIYYGGLSHQGAVLKKEIDKAGIRAHYQGTSGIIGEDFLNEVGKVNGEGIIAVREGKPVESIQGSAIFISKYNSQGYTENYDSYSAFPYVAANLLIDAVEAVGPNRSKVIKYLDEMKPQTTVIGEVNFDSHGQNLSPNDVTKFVVQDGKWVVWESSRYFGKLLSKELPK